MPTYEYACSKCGREFELFQSMKDPALTVCPKEKCTQPKWGKGKVQRLVGTGAGLIFKGSGFYITDYRSENYKAAAKKDAPAAAPATAPAAGSSSPAAGSTPAKPATTKSPETAPKTKPAKD